MSDEPALLAAILAHPDEDTPRLIYADWLDEHGQSERARLIRLQCSFAAEEPDTGNLEYVGGIARVTGVLAQLKAGVPAVPGVEWEYRRGFPEYLSAPAEQILDRYRAFARAVWLRFLSLYDFDGHLLRDFLTREWNPRWVEMALQERAADEFWSVDSTPVVAIARCQQLRQLRRLHLSLFTFTEDAVAALAESPNLDNLARLQIDGPPENSLFEPLKAKFGDRLAFG